MDEIENRDMIAKNIQNNNFRLCADVRRDVHDILLRSDIINMMYHVNTGTKPVAQISCPLDDFEEVKAYIDGHNKNHISYIIREQAFSDSKTRFISFLFYKYSYLREILDEYIDMIDKNKISRHMKNWIEGKLFGYSDFEIGEFISKH